jgi:hypothetical protein
MSILKCGDWRKMRWIMVFLFLACLSFTAGGCYPLFGVVHAADGITISGDTVMEIINETRVIGGNVVISGNATLYVYNSNLTFSMSRNYEYEVRLENPSNGFPRLIIVDSNLTSVSNRYFNVKVYDGFVNFSLVNQKIFVQYSAFDFLVYGFSNVSLSSSRLKKVNAFNFSAVNVSYCDVFGLYSKGSAKIYASKVSSLNDIHAEDGSAIFVSSPSPLAKSSTKEADIYARGDSTVQIYLTSISIGTSLTAKIEASDNGRLEIVDCSIDTLYKDVRIETYGNSFLLLSNTIVRQSVLSLYGNSEIHILNGSSLSGVQVFAFDRAKVLCSDSSVNWLLQAKDSSNVSITNSVVVLLRGVGSSSVSVSNSTVGVFQIRDLCDSNFKDSVIDQVSLEFISINLTLAGIDAGYFTYQDFVIPGVLFGLTMVDSEIKLGWSVMFHGSSNVTVVNSSLWFIGVSGSSSVDVINSTIYSSPGISGSAYIHSFSPFTVRVVDLFGNPVSGANTTLFFDGVVLDSKFSDEDGVVYFVLEKWFNASSAFTSHSFNVTVEWGGYSESKLVDWGDEWVLRDFSLSLVLPVPWWYWYAIYLGIGGAVCVTIVGVFYFVRKRRH